MAVTWIQSYVRDLQMRSILADLERASRIAAMFPTDFKMTQLLYLLLNSGDNLLRKISEF